MIRITYTEYYNDYCKYSHEANFRDLTDLENWIFKQMKQKYQNNYYVMYFPETPSRILFAPESTGAKNWIHLIENERGIIFSDGKMTNGLKHQSEEVRQWLIHCNQRQNQPTYNFVD